MRVVTNSISMKMVSIPAGEFMMGNSHKPEEELKAFKLYGIDLSPEFFENEYPQHGVRITKPFYLGVHHVTVGQFRQFVKDISYKTDAEKRRKRERLGGIRRRRSSLSRPMIRGARWDSSKPMSTPW